MKIKTGTVGYNNKILVSDGKFSLGKNVEVNLMAPVMKSHKDSNEVLLLRLAHAPTITHKSQEPKTTHNDEKVALVLFWQVVLQYEIFFDELVIMILRNGVSQNLIRLPMFDELVITILETTPDVVYVPINLSLQF